MAEETNETSPAGESVAPVAPVNNQTVNNEQLQANDDSGQIANPEAYAKAQVEKYERLFRKAEERAQQLESQLSNLQTGQQEAIQNELKQLRDELQAEKLAAENQRIEAVKVKALIENNLPADMVEFVTASDPDQIAEQVKKLAGFATKPKPTSKIGHGSGGDGGPDLSWLPGHPTYKATSFGSGWQSEE